MELAMAMIRLGETDEQRIRRILLARYKHVDPRDERIYRDLDERARAHPGELVLVATRERKYEEGSGFSFETSVSIGALKDGGLTLEGENVPVFPTGKHVRPHRFTFGPIFCYDGGVRICPGKHEVVLHLDETLEPSLPNGMTPLGVPEGVIEIPMMEIAIGNLEVVAWYERWGDERAKQLFRGLASSLDRSEALLLDANELRDEILNLFLDRRSRKRRLVHLGTIEFTVRDDDGNDVAADDRRAIESIEGRLRICLSKAVAMGMVGDVLVSVEGLCQELGVETK